MATNETASGTTQHKAGLFDIRFIIGALLGIYGVVLVLAGLLGSNAQVQKSDGVNVNLYGGIALVVVSLAFGAWARLRPIVVPEHVEDEAH